MSPKKLEILAYESTPLGLLCLRRRELLARPGSFVTEVTLDHEFLMSSLHTESERALANHALDRHEGRELKVLVGGLGLGYTAYEVLRREQVASVRVIEYLPQVIDWLEQDLFPLSADLKADARFEVTPGDVYAHLATQPEQRYDLVLIDVDHSPSYNLAQPNDRFYTVKGLTAARPHLEAKGILGIWSCAEDPVFAEALSQVFPQTAVEAISFQNILVDEATTDWLYFGML